MNPASAAARADRLRHSTSSKRSKALRRARRLRPRTASYATFLARRASRSVDRLSASTHRAASGREFGDCRHAHILGSMAIAQAGVCRLVARCGLVDRQQLQHSQARGAEPFGKPRKVARLADPPALARRHRKERNDYARAALGLVRHRHEARSKTRRIPSAKTSGSGSRLTTRYASPGKSKKYPDDQHVVLFQKKGDQLVFGDDRGNADDRRPAALWLEQLA